MSKTCSVYRPVLSTIIILLTVYLHSVKAFYCRPTQGNITSLIGNNNNCPCLFDDHSGWVIYEMNNIFPITTSHNNDNNSDDNANPDESKTSVSSIGNSSTIINNDNNNNDDAKSKETKSITIEAFSTYAGVTSKCQLVYESANADVVDRVSQQKQMVYCPYDVSKNMDRSRRHNITLLVTQTKRIFNNSNNNTNNNNSDSDNNNNKTAKPITTTATTTITTTTMWASYSLPTIKRCHCNFTQPWSWVLGDQWDIIKIEWPTPEAARNYLYNITSVVQTKVFFKQSSSISGDGDVIQAHPVCSESKTATKSCIIHDITDFVDIRRNFTICVYTTIPSCVVDLHDHDTSCKNVILKPFSLFDHFKVSQMSCHHHQSKGDNRIRVAWETENRADNKPDGLEYGIALLKSNSDAITETFVIENHGRDVAKEYTFNGYGNSDQVASVRIQVCIQTTATAKLDVTSPLPTRQCGNPRFVECTREDADEITDVHLAIIVASVTVIAAVSATCIILWRKRLQNLSSSDNHNNRSNGAVEFSVIVNSDGNTQRQSLDSQYDEMSNDFTIEPETNFDTIDVT